MKRFLVAIIHVDDFPWKEIVERGQIPLWHSTNLSEIEIAYFVNQKTDFSQFLNSVVETLRWRCGRIPSYLVSYFLMFLLFPIRFLIPKYRFERMVLDFPLYKVSLPETSFFIRWKRIAIFDFFLQNSNFDFLVMVNSSSFLNFNNLRKEIQTSTTFADAEIGSPYAGGPIQDSADGKFISGAFMVLNRTAVQILMKNVRKIPVHVMDDIAIGTALRRLAVPLSPLSTLVVEEFLDDKGGDVSILGSASHFRFVSYKFGKRMDASLMNRFKSIFDSKNS